MFSLNIPVPGRVGRIAGDLHPELSRFERIRDRHTLVAKRFDTGLDDADSLPRLRERLRPLLRRSPGPIELRITGLDYFADPPRGTGPVVYLAVESSDLTALHRRLCGAFGTVEAIEGDDYVPHVTLARGGSVEDARDVVERREIEQISWTADELHVWDSRYREAAARIPLG